MFVVARQYIEMYRDAEERNDTGASNMMFFNHIGRMYVSYMAGDDATHDALDEELHNTFGRRCEALPTCVSLLMASVCSV